MLTKQYKLLNLHDVISRYGTYLQIHLLYYNEVESMAHIKFLLLGDPLVSTVWSTAKQKGLLIPTNSCSMSFNWFSVF